MSSEQRKTSPENASAAPLLAQVRPIVKVRVPDAATWSREVAREVRELCAALGCNGWDFVEIAEAIETSRRSLYAWRLGEAEMPASKLLALRDLVAREVRRAG